MANVKSAIKRARQNVKRRERNQALRSAAKTEAKKALDGIQAAKSRNDGLVALAAGARALQKAASKGVFPRERVNRKIARLAAMLNAKFKPEAQQAARAR